MHCLRKDVNGRIHFKIVFYGPSMGGKTTTLKWLYNNVAGLEKGDFTQIADPTGRTLFFDLAPMQATETVVFDVYTTAGQERHKKQRKVVLNGVDGILFVADSSPEQLGENIESINELREFLGEKLGTEIPLVVALNKRDVPNALPRKELIMKLKLDSETPIYETIATTGVGVKHAFQTLTREIILRQIHGLMPKKFS